MLIDKECVGCIINQSLKVANAIGADESLTNELHSRVTDMSRQFSFAHNPPEIASDVYEKMAQIANKKDLYDEIKELSTQKASALVPMLKETLQELYPNTNYSYMVRGNPIINDLTMKEAIEAGFDILCNLVDSGVNTPGFTYTRANENAQKLFDSADVVISKGMGNYECLNESKRSNIFFLLKVKCDVVANSLKKRLGDIICKSI